MSARLNKKIRDWDGWDWAIVITVYTVCGVWAAHMWGLL